MLNILEYFGKDLSAYNDLFKMLRGTVGRRSTWSTHKDWIMTDAVGRNSSTVRIVAQVDPSGWIFRSALPCWVWRFQRPAALVVPHAPRCSKMTFL